MTLDPQSLMDEIDALRASIFALTEKRNEEVLELKAEVTRLRDLKNEAIEQSEQWRRAFLDAEYERLRLSSELKELAIIQGRTP